MRLVYFGTPADAVLPLHALVDAGHDIAFVVTQPDRRRTRGTGTDPSPVKQAAAHLGILVRTPEKAREVVDDVREAGADLGVVVAFGQILPVPLLEATKHGFVNLHFSLLPRWRGAAPVERAMLAGDPETGVCLMRLEAGLDTGPVYACTRTPIGPDETAGELRARLVDLGTALLIEHLPIVPSTTPEPQVGEPTYADKLDVEEFRLDPYTGDSIELARVVRAGNPRPGAWFTVHDNRVKVWRAHYIGSAIADATESLEPGVLAPDGRLGTTRGDLALDEVQPAGRRSMDARSWLAGLRGEARVDAQVDVQDA